MTDEEAFLQHLDQTPDDDTARLVYADWLDESGPSSRAAFLRAECQWAVSPLTFQRFQWKPGLGADDLGCPPVLRALTDLAPAVPGDWFVRCSRVVWEVRSLVRRFAALVPGVHLGDPTDPLEQRARWVAATQRVREMFERYVGEKTALARFAMPADYLAFALCSDGIECPDEFGMSYFDLLHNTSALAARTAGHCATYVHTHGPQADFAACGLWLFVGNRDRHDFHLCCDRASPLFGTLVDMNDSHPWISPPHGPTPSSVVARCFLDFLRLQAAKAEDEFGA
ncbi:MAG: TIGR02996 domain-containing protein [Gemmataceae bacterium]|nr:TIGR02996 domain-containing protein [Gemmataceae bacterium]